MADQYVVPHRRGWAVRTEGSRTPIAFFPTKEAAETKARQLAMKNHGKVILLRKDGSFQDNLQPEVTVEVAQKLVHVFPHRNKWAVRIRGLDRKSRLFLSKYRAIAFAKILGQKENIDVVVHNDDGTFSYVAHDM